MDGRRGLLGACALAACSVVHAAGLQLQPVAVTLAPGDTSATVWVTNPHADPISVSVGVFAWRQPGGEEELGTTRELAVSPVRADIPAGARQRLRVVLLLPPVDGREHSYRLILDEQPATAGPVLARYSLPVFVHVDEGAPVQLAASVTAIDDGSTQLRIDNPGRRHARIVDLAYRTPDGTHRSLAPDLAGYVLPGSHKHWILPGPVEQFRTGHFEATVNGRVVNLTVD